MFHLSIGERAVWAAAFVAALYAGRHPKEAAQQAANGVMVLRALPLLRVDELVEPATAEFAEACALAMGRS